MWPTSTRALPSPCGHINGGHTALSEAHVCELCERSSRAIEIVHNGNEKVAIAAAQMALQLKCLVMIDGIVRCGRSRNTPPATEVPVVVALNH